MKHKIMTVMARREREMPLSGRVEMDDTYLGGVRSGGKRGLRRGRQDALWAMSLSLLKFVGQASLVDDAMLPS